MALGLASLADYATAPSIASSVYNAWEDRVVATTDTPSALLGPQPPSVGGAGWSSLLRQAARALRCEMERHARPMRVVVLGAGAMREVAEILESGLDPFLARSIHAVEPVEGVARVGMSLLETGSARSWWPSLSGEPVVARLEAPKKTGRVAVSHHACLAEEYLASVRRGTDLELAIVAVGVWDRVESVCLMRDLIVEVGTLAVIANPRDWRGPREAGPDATIAFGSIVGWRCESQTLSVRFVEAANAVYVHSVELAVARRLR